MGEYIVEHLVNLPTKVRAVTVLEADGGYTIYLNAKLPLNQQRDAALHELRHIAYDHLYDDIRTIGEIEREASASESR